MISNDHNQHQSFQQLKGGPVYCDPTLKFHHCYHYHFYHYHVMKATHCILGLTVDALRVSMYCMSFTSWCAIHTAPNRLIIFRFHLFQTQSLSHHPYHLLLPHHNHNQHHDDVHTFLVIWWQTAPLSRCFLSVPLSSLRVPLCTHTQISQLE